MPEDVAAGDAEEVVTIEEAVEEEEVKEVEEFKEVEGEEVAQPPKTE